MNASVVCGSGSGVRVGSVDMQVRCIVIFALGHRVLHIPGIIPPVVSAVFHGLFEGAEQSYTSLSCCSIASNATMQTADNERTPEVNRKTSMLSRTLTQPAREWRTMFNCEQLQHGCRKYVYFTRFRVARQPFYRAVSGEAIRHSRCWQQTSAIR